jgi:hypothetical protein
VKQFFYDLKANDDRAAFGSPTSSRYACIRESGFNFAQDVCKLESAQAQMRMALFQLHGRQKVDTVFSDRVVNSADKEESIERQNTISFGDSKYRETAPAEPELIPLMMRPTSTDRMTLI